MSSDYIRRADAVDALTKTMPTPATPDGTGEFDYEIHIADEAFADAISIIESLEPADVVSKNDIAVLLDETVKELTSRRKKIYCGFLYCFGYRNRQVQNYADGREEGWMNISASRMWLIQ